MNKRFSWSGFTRTQLALIGSFLAAPTALWAAAPTQPGTPFDTSSNGNTSLAVLPATTSIKTTAI